MSDYYGLHKAMMRRLGKFAVAVAFSAVGCAPALQGPSTVAFAQTAGPTSPALIFHVQGTIESPWDSMFGDQLFPTRDIKFEGAEVPPLKATDGEASVRVPRSEVTFAGDHATKTVVVDEKGVYHADLPVGFYKMSVQGPSVAGLHLKPYTRAFRVSAPTTLVINVLLEQARLTCDGVFWGDTREEQSESFKDTCGGDDVVSLPATDGTPFELSIRYPARQVERYGLLYEGGEEHPVYVSYNLMFLRANQVHYFAKRHEILASGNVVLEDGSGKVQRLRSVSLMFQDGVAAKYRDELPRALQYDQGH